MFHQNCIILLIFLGMSLPIRIQCDSIDIDKIKEQLPKNLQIPLSLQNVALPSADDLKRLVQEKCSNVSGSDAAFKAIESGIVELRTCMTGLFDVTIDQLQKEIEDAKPRGELDTVFNKYCVKRDTAVGCFETFVNLLEPCLQPKEIESKQTFVKVLKEILKFVCHKDGDQIALFYAEKGPECFSQTKDELVTCMNSTFYGYIPSDLSTNALPKELPELVISEKQCDEMQTLQTCFVKALEKCEESTPANLVESMFRFVRRQTICANN